MGQKVIIRFWWESGLSSASRNHLTTFCLPFANYACLRLCSAITLLETWVWHQIVTSRATHTKFKRHHTPLNETPMKIFCVRHWSQMFKICHKCGKNAWPDHSGWWDNRLTA